MNPSTLRVATYNIHKCKGMDRRVDARRVAAVVRETEADVVAMQEVVRVSDGRLEHDQLGFLAAELGFASVEFGENRKILTGIYGNGTISRLPILFATNYDVSHARRERRGCLRTDVSLDDGRVLHVLNVHLGTGYMERRAQAKRLLSEGVLLNPEMRGPKIVLGDFNEWTRGLVTRMLGERFASCEVPERRRKMRSYPGVAPVLHLDHIYYDRELELVDFRLHRSRTALVASDHLPLVAEFRI